MRRLDAATTDRVVGVFRRKAGGGMWAEDAMRQLTHHGEGLGDDRVVGLAGESVAKLLYGFGDLGFPEPGVLFLMGVDGAEHA